MSAKKFAVIRTGGKQYKVSSGDTIVIEKLPGEIGTSVDLSQVLSLGTEGSAEMKIGTPLIAGATVSGKIVKHGRGSKVITFKKGRRTGYTKKIGHRQEQTAVQIDSIKA